MNDQSGQFIFISHTVLGRLLSRPLDIDIYFSPLFILAIIIFERNHIRWIIMREKLSIDRLTHFMIYKNHAQNAGFWFLRFMKYFLDQGTDPPKGDLWIGRNRNVNLLRRLQTPFLWPCPSWSLLHLRFRDIRFEHGTYRRVWSRNCL